MKTAHHSLNHLELLEAEAIHILREAAAQFENPVILYSVGKDSSVVVRLAQKAFYPAKFPFPLLHVDTSYDFPEMYEFRDKFVKEIGAKLIVYRNEKALGENANPYDLGTQKCCGVLRTQALLDALRQGGFDAAVGGARREEEKSRAKERVFSFRDKFGQWDPKNQRPELWNQYNGKVNKGECIRIFPLSNWTELDVWHYIHVEKIPIVPLYLAAERQVVVRCDQIIPLVSNLGSRQILPGEKPESMLCRFRTLGCTPCTGAVRSNADTLPAVIEEMIAAKISERSTRVIDHDADGSMEMKKREGYF
ncbi:MAG: sulfate adenylyltransferase subunit CysD [Proteobacteria bacterium]|nr:MAG: sulfate adenylyltransferase subunit CysD [Pseudomonadota bacterium]